MENIITLMNGILAAVGAIAPQGLDRFKRRNNKVLLPCPVYSPGLISRSYRNN
jgi:hypothetical protein